MPIVAFASSTVAFTSEGWGLIDLVTSVGVTKSRGEALRLVRAGGLYVNERRVVEERARLTVVDAIGGQVFVRGHEAFVDDADDHPGIALGQLPGLGDLQFVEQRLLPRIGQRPGRGRFPGAEGPGKRGNADNTQRRSCDRYGADG